jgi:hypothetical protein
MNEQSIKKLIHQVLQEDPKLNEGYEETQILNAWQQVTGNRITQQVEKAFVRDKILFVQVTTSVLRQELYFRKSKICRDINSMLKNNKLRDIILK